MTGYHTYKSCIEACLMRSYCNHCAMKIYNFSYLMAAINKISQTKI
jgi:hypothetical protein